MKYEIYLFGNRIRGFDLAIKVGFGRGSRWNSRLQTVWLLLLIFCMGVSIGRNGEVVRSLPLLGGKAVLFAVMTAIGSIAVVYILSTLFLEKEGKK